MQIFKNGLMVMTNLYSSMCGTATIQLKDVPEHIPAYSCDRGEPYSGWCTAEQGVASMAVAHLTKAAAEATLPERIQAAQRARPKLTDLSGGGVRNVAVNMEPLKLLEQTAADIEGATFVGKGDRDMVKQMLAVFEWDMRTALARATTDYTASGQTVDGAVRKRSASIKRRASASPRETPTSALIGVHDAL